MRKKISLKTVRQVLVMILLVVVSGGTGYWWGNRGANLRPVSFQSGSEANLTAFWEVWRRLEQSYLDPDEIKADKMVEGAISGMTAALGDPYTAYLPPAANKQSQEDLNGEFAGVGIQLGFIDRTLAVMSPLPGQPAEKAGIKAGDLILHIKDEQKELDVDTDGMSLAEAVQNIRGAKGNQVVLTIFREGDKQSQEYALIRDTIVVPSVELKLVDKDGREDKNGPYAWIRVSKFGDKTMTEWRTAVNQILGNKKVDGVVLDLRNNPGGFLQRAVDLASEFMESGVVVQQQGRVKTESFSVNHRGSLVGKKLVVLVNKGSASASEILAGALREQLGVKLVGENTFGKGTVQEAQELPDGSGLHVTIAKWLLPKGTNIHKVGLKPDIEVELKEVEGGAPLDNQLVEAIKQISG